MSSVRPGGNRSDVPFLTLPHLLKAQAKRAPDAHAIIAPGRHPLSYQQLSQHVEHIGRTLRAIGIGRQDRIAVAMPNGPEMAVAILIAAANAVSAPINPAYGAEELDRYFGDLRPRALMAEAGSDSLSRRVALSRGIRVLEIASGENSEAGLFTLTADRGDTPSENHPVSPGDVALLFLTSGTTSRPKIVPLTHANICTSAYSSRAALSLRDTDRCLNVLPLFHGHGLIATVLASLAVGASVVCTPGCDVERFFAWLTRFRPTWYSAVPTMHKAILAQARNHRDEAAECGLRFIRSASAPLPSSVCVGLERTFDTCVIDAYAMMETASAPIACNPLPPGKRKLGSVGVPVDLDVAIMDERGALLPTGETGEVVVRGASVMSGYDGDPTATDAAFAGTWLKTGDNGFFDQDGYLFLVGRSREMINRGGEKIAPQEIDDVLLEHPAVVEAVTFSIPHPTLGEDIASAVVLREPSAATPDDIRRSLKGRVAGFKVPRQVVIVNEITKGPTGKVQRVGLAAKLGLTERLDMPQTSVAPRTPLEKILTEIWAEVLQLEQICIYDDFFELGGDSLSVAHVLARIYEIMHLEIDASLVFDAPTVAALAKHIATLIPAEHTVSASSLIGRAPREHGVVASIAQERLWKLQRVLPGMPFFNILHALRLTSPLNAPTLERSLNEIVRRHEILRTTFAVVDGQYVQVIAPHLAVQLRCDDLQTKSVKENIAHEVIQEEILHSFDLTKGPLFRTRLVRLTHREHLLLINMHQTIGDGWSRGVLRKELAALYAAFVVGGSSPLAPLSIQYADFAYWQRHWQLDRTMVAQLEYWRQQLHDPLPLIEFAPARPRRTADDLVTRRYRIAIPTSLLEAVKRFSQREGGTLFMTLVSALKILLHGYLGQEDLLVATLVANRNRAGTEGLIGPLVNTVILRTDLGGDPSSREVMRRVRATTLAAFANQDLPFEVLATTLERERGVKPAMLAQVMLQLQNATLRPIPSAQNTITLEEADPSMLVPLVTATTFELILALHETEDGLSGSCVYKPHLFDAATINRLVSDFHRVLEEMVTQPGQPISKIHVPLFRCTEIFR